MPKKSWPTRLYKPMENSYSLHEAMVSTILTYIAEELGCQPTSDSREHNTEVLRGDVTGCVMTVLQP